MNKRAYDWYLVSLCACNYDFNVLFYALSRIFHTPYFILTVGSVINKVVGTLAGLLGLFLCLAGHRFFDFGECVLYLLTSAGGYHASNTIDSVTNYLHIIMFEEDSEICLCVILTMILCNPYHGTV